VGGQVLVLWRGPGGPVVGPDVCPHMGAELSRGRVEGGRLICPWHGLALLGRRHGSWRPLPAYDDGVLTWVRLPSEHPTDMPLLTKRPEGAATAVVERPGRCDVRDVIENRLDPWHGRHLHPYAFADLAVLDEDESGITVRVDYRIVGPLAARVVARFEAPEAATVRMVILDGTGAGSVVETHATQEGPGRSRVIEAVFAVAPGVDLSERRGIAAIRWFLGRVAGRLWIDDIAYAERRYALRHGEVTGWADREVQAALPADESP
jgi:uncharacterized protein DUF5914/Rieske 2Fe-2S protein